MAKELKKLINSVLVTDMGLHMSSSIWFGEDAMMCMHVV